MKAKIQQKQEEEMRKFRLRNMREHAKFSKKYRDVYEKFNKIGPHGFPRDRRSTEREEEKGPSFSLRAYAKAYTPVAALFWIVFVTVIVNLTYMLLYRHLQISQTAARDTSLVLSIFIVLVPYFYDFRATFCIVIMR